MILCIDPGAKKAGAALFDPDGSLVKAWLVTGEDWRQTADNVASTVPAKGGAIKTVVIEKMQIYSDTPTAQANACIVLSLMAGRVTGIFRSWNRDNTVAYLPKKWKGQVPKGIHNQRIKNELTPAERQRVKLPRLKKGHADVWDAVGIGLYHLRAERRLFSCRDAAE